MAVRLLLTRDQLIAISTRGSSHAFNKISFGGEGWNGSLGESKNLNDPTVAALNKVIAFLDSNPFSMHDLKKMYHPDYVIDENKDRQLLYPISRPLHDLIKCLNSGVDGADLYHWDSPRVGYPLSACLDNLEVHSLMQDETFDEHIRHPDRTDMNESHLPHWLFDFEDTKYLKNVAYMLYMIQGARCKEGFPIGG